MVTCERENCKQGDLEKFNLTLQISQRFSLIKRVNQIILKIALSYSRKIDKMVEKFSQIKNLRGKKMLPKEPDKALAPSERRQSDRKKLIVNVNFEGGDGTGIANTRDIGIGGLYMLTNAELEIGMPLFMRMSIGGEEIGIDGVVTYIDPGHGVGIRFQAMSEKNEEILKRELHLE